MHARKGVDRYKARWEPITSLVKCKSDLIANTGKLHTRKGAWLHLDDQSGRIYLAPMAAAYNLFLIVA